MRILILIAVIFALAASGVYGQTGGSVDNPNTPNDYSVGQSECMLDTLTFKGGLQLVGQFQSNKFHYTCSCANLGQDLTVIVVPRTKEDGSSAEITFNDVKVNFRSNNPPNAISNTGPTNIAPNSPLFESSPLHFAPGTNTIKIGVGCNKRATPTCYYQYIITCDYNSYIVGDPAFVGLRGQKYQVHGVSGEIYNIVSDADFQYNSRFVFLDSGDCPIVNGVKQRGCWHEPGTYLGEIGFKTRAGDEIHLVTGHADDGYQSVTLNGKEVEIGDTILLADGMGSVTRNDTHLAAIQVGNWDFLFENSDMFVNQRVRVMDSRNLQSHGLLGQTWRDKTYKNPIKYIEGRVDDYVIKRTSPKVKPSIYGTNFEYNQFNI